MQSLSFPMRLKENGLLHRDSQEASLIQLLQVMARTPAGSWSACPEFGLRDLFEDGRLRADVARIVMERTNHVLEDLGLTEFSVAEVVREISPLRDTETYSITFMRTSGGETFSTTVRHS